MKTSTWVIVIIAVTCFALFLVGTSQLDKQTSREKEKYKEQIGKTIVIAKDTLIVTDYNIFLEHFTLSNGSKVSSQLIFKR